MPLGITVNDEGITEGRINDAAYIMEIRCSRGIFGNEVDVFSTFCFQELENIYIVLDYL